jgi:acetolactate synthase I/II/III large subunit
MRASMSRPVAARRALCCNAAMDTETPMNGAARLVHTLIDAGVDTCFANPGTSEMHFVAALDRIAGIRCVLGLAEGVVTGAADGYWRVTDRPASTLLHCGPGLANGLANLHNARKAGSGIVNVVGDHASFHVAFDAPLTADVEGLARPVSHWVRTVDTADGLAPLAREAVVQARMRPGRIATLVLPADRAWEGAGPPQKAAGIVPEAMPGAPDSQALGRAVECLRKAPQQTLLLLGGRALRAGASMWAGRIAAATGCGVMSAFYGARIERGSGRVALPRVPYAVEPALAALAPYRHLVLVGASPPVAFFAYPGKPGQLTAPGADTVPLCDPSQDEVEALRALAEALGAARAAPRLVSPGAARPPTTDGRTDAAGLGALLAARIPEGAIVVDEAVSTGRGFDAATAAAAPHDWLTGMGGSIGFGLPAAVGAALGAPGRRVVALEGDGSAMYTPQALWTMAREGLDVTVLIFANRGYRILHGEFASVGAGAPGPRASDMLSIDRPALDWVGLARSMGVPAASATTLGELDGWLERWMLEPGPSLIEVQMS